MAIQLQLYNKSNGQSVALRCVAYDVNAVM